ncbi:MAG: hypothetical protein H6696_07220 [Deferribacteres bacterium]|nr:hypothetical protein [candidate division KSB1 bacterium]MCB9501713.1 hypothetical protein [Deferribacteres bacterium]
MYLGFVITIFSIAILYQRVISSFARAALFFILTNRWYIRYEEKIMLAKFGPEFEAYRNETRRWI